MATPTVRPPPANPLDAPPTLRLPHAVNLSVHDPDQIDQLEEQGFKLLLASLGALPLVSYLTLLLFACYAAQVTGHWPAYATPNPWTLSSTATTLIELLIGLSAILAPIYLLLLAFGTFSEKSRPRSWLRSALAATTDRIGAACYLIGLVLWLSLSRSLLLWLFD